MRERSQTELVRVSVFHMESTYVLCVCQREKRERELLLRVQIKKDHVRWWGLFASISMSVSSKSWLGLKQ